MTETEQTVQVPQNEPAFSEGLRAEGIVKVRLVRGKPVTDVGALRKYHREYYHANKQEGECEPCKSKFSSESALARHQRSAQKCLLQRARAELEVLRKQ